VSVYVEGEGDAWIDGHPIAGPGAPTTVVAGEHLVQAHDEAGWHAVVREMSEDTRVSVGSGLDLVGLGEALVEPEPVEPEPQSRSTFKRPHRVGVIVGGAAGAAAGGVAIAWAFSREAKFNDATFMPPAFGDCEQGEACYEAEREKAIRSEATLIRATYATGYALTGIGIALLGAELFFLPAPAQGGGSVAVRFQW